ncbi:LCP family protein [Corynebacterium uberis]|uniref:LCP family protein n=1 Tax=Corynebacterium uberis TaxID=2883169 RepID=UPI0037DC2EE5
MNHTGHEDPRRRERRTSPPRPATPGGPGEDVLRGRDGKPLLDRYGRPVRRRTPPPRPSAASQPRRAERPRAPQPRDYGDRDFAGGQQRGGPQQYIPPRPSAQPAHTAYLDPRSAAGNPPGGYGAPPQPPQQPQQPYRPQAAPSAQPAQPWQDAPPAQPPRAPRTRRASGSRRRPRRGCLGCFGWPLAILLVVAIVGTLWADSALTRTTAKPDQQIHATSGTNWLLVGSDSRQGLSEKDVQRLGTGGDIGVGRTDTIMLLHIPTTGKATLVSLPRDSYVEIPGYGMNKINAAFTYGGAPLLTSTVEGATGVHIDHYAEIGMGGLAKVVDAIGGVRVCPTEDIADPLAQLDITAGCQKVDGPTALGYVRTRATAMGDLDRVERQREFFASLLDAITSPSTLINPWHMFQLVRTTAASFTVGNSDHVWHLARVALAMRSGVETQTVPIGGFADYDVGNVALWDDAAAEALWASLR